MSHQFTSVQQVNNYALAVATFNHDIKILTDSFCDTTRCTLFLQGYCEFCRSYVANRNGSLIIIDTDDYRFDYNAERNRVQAVHRQLTSFTSLNLAPEVLANLSDDIPEIDPDSDAILHQECPDPQAHEHTCPECMEPHCPEIDHHQWPKCLNPACHAENYCNHAKHTMFDEFERELVKQSLEKNQMEHNHQREIDRLENIISQLEENLSQAQKLAPKLLPAEPSRDKPTIPADLSSPRPMKVLTKSFEYPEEPESSKKISPSEAWKSSSTKPELPNIASLSLKEKASPRDIKPSSSSPDPYANMTADERAESGIDLFDDSASTITTSSRRRRLPPPSASSKPLAQTAERESRAEKGPSKEPRRSSSRSHHADNKDERQSTSSSFFSPFLPVSTSERRRADPSHHQWERKKSDHKK